MFLLCSVCDNMMHQGSPTQSHEERCIIGTWVVDEARKSIEMGYDLVDLFECQE